MKWCEIFRTGKHTDSKGNSREWTEADLQQICNNFESKNSDVPICVGHPKTNSPAYGWIESLKSVGGKLYASFKDVQPEFQEAVNKGLFKTRSISLTRDLVPRHIAFLGAQAPAIKGMEQFCFADCEPDANDIIINFSESKNDNDNADESALADPAGAAGISAPLERGGVSVEKSDEIGSSTNMGGKSGSEAGSPSTPHVVKLSAASPIEKEGDEMDAELKRQLAAKDEELAAAKKELEKVRQEALKKEFEEFCDNAIESGNILPAHRDNVLNLLFANTDTNINFDDGSSKSSNEVLKEFVKSLRQMDFQKISNEKDALSDKEINFSDAEEVKESIQALQKEYEDKGIGLNPAQALEKLKG